MYPLTIGILMVLLSIPWWILYFVRLTQVVHRGHFARMPNFYLYLSPYGTGLLYYLGSYELEQRLQIAFTSTSIPFVSILKILISVGFISYGYILMVRRYTHFSVTRKIDPAVLGFIGFTIICNLILYDHFPYLKLQSLTNVLIGFALLVAAVSILPIVRYLTKSRQNQVREAHYLWFIVSLIAACWSTILTFVDSFQKLFTDSPIVYSPLFVLTEVSQTVYMIAAAFLMSPDRYLYWIYYPSCLRTYFKLKRLAERIREQTHVQLLTRFLCLVS